MSDSEDQPIPSWPYQCRPQLQSKKSGNQSGRNVAPILPHTHTHTHTHTKLKSKKEEKIIIIVNIKREKTGSGGGRGRENAELIDRF